MADIKIVVDTSSDIPKEMLEKYDIGLLSFISIFGEEAYVSGVDLSNQEFYEKLEQSGQIPTTSQTPYADMYDYLLEQTRLHESVIYFTISSKGSGQNHTANMVAEDILLENPEADLHIVDTMTFSLYIAQTACHAAELVRQGKSVEEILAECAAYVKSWHALLLVDTLKYLEKGGRINKAAAIVGTLLDIKPVLTIRDGLVEAEDKLRGKKKILDKLIEKVKEHPAFNAEHPEFLVVHSDAQKGEELKKKLQQEFQIDDITMLSEFGPIVGTHTGPGAVAVIFRTK
jgi:DegV family protein with EDD domain